MSHQTCRQRDKRTVLHDLQECMAYIKLALVTLDMMRAAITSIARQPNRQARLDMGSQVAG